ncbi:uncharacterized protein LOC132198423 isoform X2 [Neocloeon triangulifer]|uniref:uncharacterized protein LOC132198423 isoform X2 n=1 Tax=Neocloeon triangulifer TaxID=2078957 RepID=UPI00286F1AD6|nr:uncharacterized protein LOC132198423 isoform X2 [Neocloeon triangulifer]
MVSVSPDGDLVYAMNVQTGEERWLQVNEITNMPEDGYLDVLGVIETQEIGADGQVRTSTWMMKLLSEATANRMLQMRRYRSLQVAGGLRLRSGAPRTLSRPSSSNTSSSSASSSAASATNRQQVDAHNRGGTPAAPNNVASSRRGSNLPTSRDNKPGKI